MASRISETVDPDPPWNTKSIGLSSKLYFSDISSCDFFSIVGFNFTFPGLYTPWTLPNAAATVNLSLISISFL